MTNELQALKDQLLKHEWGLDKRRITVEVGESDWMECKVLGARLEMSSSALLRYFLHIGLEQNGGIKRGKK
jgi:hypothetical protein